MQSLKTVKFNPNFWPDNVPEMTDEEARKKLCIGPEGCGRWLRGSPSEEERRCVGARCMAWVRGRDLIEIAVMVGYTLGKVTQVRFPGEVEARIVPPSEPIDHRPEGEDWMFSHLFGGTEIGHWWRVVAERGYCGFSPEKPVRPVQSRVPDVTGRRPGTRFTDGRGGG